jgi:hypothetical protein
MCIPFVFTDWSMIPRNSYKLHVGIILLLVQMKITGTVHWHKFNFVFIMPCFRANKLYSDKMCINKLSGGSQPILIVQVTYLTLIKSSLAVSLRRFH